MMDLIKKSIVALVLFFVMLYVSVALFLGAQVYTDTKTKSDAILVLGTKATYNGKDSPCLVSRIDHAIDLYHQNYAKTLIVSGGDDEAVTMKKIAMKAGVPSQAIIEEVHATSTYENFIYSQKLMKQKKIDSLIIVTEPFHIPRASLIAQKLKIPHTVSPSLDSPCWNRWQFLSQYFLREPLVTIVYWLERKI